ncbi:EAL domain-containing protein [Diaphorobacter sp. HDW4B]|uniref:putative bifunctional diguanylate cyclase/phosphodiesterase n=1 Tax=Diaphorobacter sp. HDW4B TaxID=2714925 RepID=UPI001409E5FB|nr:bifunctional diguanylate cyclase/phosphodiesterase [Diaphorobacter sp. HDW4B]QIL70656.1 EAL domain-containing protein [Diaphorobacter sp. HDW4B]
MGQPTQLKSVIGGKKAMRGVPSPVAAADEGTAKLMRKAVDSLPCLVWMGAGKDQAGWANAAWREFTGMESSNWLHAVHPESVDRMQRLWDEALASKVGFQEEVRLRDRDGNFRWFLVAVLFRETPDDAQTQACLNATDVHERILARQSLIRNLGMQEKMLDASVDCIKIVNPDGTLAHMNLSGCKALGVSPDSGFGMKWLELLPPEIHAAGLRAFRQALRGSNARFSGKSVVPGKPAQYWDNILTPVLDDNGKTMSILCVSRDVTQQQLAEERLRRANEFDELTELPNRRAFKEELRPTLLRAREKGSGALLMLIDLDHFKHLNDTLGHAAGDHLLQVMARRIQSCLPDSSYVARIGGDEFAIIVPDVKDDNAIMRVAHKVVLQLDPPINYASKRINGSMSVGCALYPRDARDPMVLLSHADAALNDIKVNGRGGVRIFSPEIMQPLEDAAVQMEQARRILRDGTVRAHYQPKVRLLDRKLVGVEALLRSQDVEHGGLQMPGTVQAAFLNYDLATRIADALRAKVFADLVTWQRAGLQVVPVSLNAAPVEFMRDNYAERLLKQLEKACVDPALIELEVTEQTLDERGAKFVTRALLQLKQAGIRVALDDFGTGHSSLTRLRNFPVDCLKIDSNLVGNFGSDPAITAVVHAIGRIGADLSLELVAEGIETEKQSQALLSAGYEIGQGHLFSRAVSADAIATLLANEQAVWEPSSRQVSAA